MRSTTTMGVMCQINQYSKKQLNCSASLACLFTKHPSPFLSQEAEAGKGEKRKRDPEDDDEDDDDDDDD